MVPFVLLPKATGRGRLARQEGRQGTLIGEGASNEVVPAKYAVGWLWSSVWTVLVTLRPSANIRCASPFGKSVTERRHQSQNSGNRSVPQAILGNFSE